MSASASTTNTVQDGTDDALLDQILQVAIDASKKAGEIILGNAGGAEVTERKANSRDLLTLIDPLCEKVCTSVTIHTSTYHM
jgi:myo-inositol-1(or 4)-monophosphatase